MKIEREYGISANLGLRADNLNLGHSNLHLRRVHISVVLVFDFFLDFQQETKQCLRPDALKDVPQRTMRLLPNFASPWPTILS